MLTESSPPTIGRAKGLGHRTTCLKAAKLYGDFQECLHIVAKNVLHPLALAGMGTDHFDLLGKCFRDVNVNLRHKVHAGRRVHEMDVGNVRPAEPVGIIRLTEIFDKRVEPRLGEHLAVSDNSVCSLTVRDKTSRNVSEGRERLQNNRVVNSCEFPIFLV